MSGVRAARTALMDARARRQRSESAVEQTWNDGARQAFRRQVLDPLDLETSKLDAAMRELDEELAKALVVLA